MQKFTQYLLKHQWQSFVLVFATALLSICCSHLLDNAPKSVAFIGIFVTFSLSLFGILFATVATLMEGMLFGGLLTLATTLPYAAPLTVLPANHAERFMLLFGLFVAVTSNILTYVFAVLVKKRWSLSTVLQLSALGAVLAISILHLLYPAIGDWWAKEILNLQTLYAAQHGVAPVSTAEQAQGIAFAKQIATGLLFALVLVSALTQLLCARWWQVRLQDTDEQSDAHYLHLLPLSGILFSASLLLSYYGNPVVLDFMPVMYTLFFIAGLSLAHYLFRLFNSTTIWFWILLFYITLGLTVPYSFIFLALLGFSDIWLDVRKRFRKT